MRIFENLEILLKCKKLEKLEEIFEKFHEFGEKSRVPAHSGLDNRFTPIMWFIKETWIKNALIERKRKVQQYFKSEQTIFESANEGETLQSNLISSEDLDVLLMYHVVEADHHEVKTFFESRPNYNHKEKEYSEYGRATLAGVVHFNSLNF